MPFALIVIGTMLFIISICILYVCIGNTIKEKRIYNTNIKSYSSQLEELNPNVQTQIFMLMLSGDTAKKVGNIPSYREITNAQDFHLSFEALMDVEIMLDKMRNKIAVNQCAWYMVKYYDDLIMEYGYPTEKAVYYKNIKLLKLSGLIHD